MNLTTRELVTLAQVLAIHADRSYGTSDFQRAWEALRKRIEDEIAGQATPYVDPIKFDDDDLFADDEGPDEEAEDDEFEEESSASQAHWPESEEPGESRKSPEEAASSTSADRRRRREEALLRADRTISQNKLAKLQHVKDAAGAVLKFERERDSVVLTWNGTIVVEPVTHVRRLAREIHLRDLPGNWVIYNVPKFTPKWTKVLPVGKLVEVTER